MWKGEIIIDSQLRTKLSSYIWYLTEMDNILNPILQDVDFADWISNCIKCLQFAISNETILEEKPYLYNDILDILHLLDLWVVEDDQYAYIVLREKFKTVFSPEQVGKSLRLIIERIQSNKVENEPKNINVHH